MRLSTCDCRFKLFYIGKSNTIFILNKHFVSFFGTVANIRGLFL